MIDLSALQPTKTKVSSVTTAWGVNWSETLIARVWQNFYDANRERVVDIYAASNHRTVLVSVPPRANAAS